MKRLLSLGPWAALALVLPACSDDASETDDGAEPTSSETSGPPESSTTESSTTESSTTEPEVDCPAPTQGPTIHNGDISSDETWTADASPHIIETDVRVRDGWTLTIEPCAEVLLEENAYISIAAPLRPNQGTLIAEGTETRPIRIAGHDGAHWVQIYVATPGTARLAYVTLEGGGGQDVNNHDGATLELWGDAELGADPVVFVDHVTITGSRGAGVALGAGATFIEGSHDLVVTDSGSEAYPYPVTLEEHSIDALPTGSYTGNAIDEILVRRYNRGLAVDATLHERGVPYRVEGDFRVGTDEEGTLATLTIEPGVVLKFSNGEWFDIHVSTSETPATGALKALGTAEQPIVFTSAADTPAPGDWGGLWFGAIPSATNELDHVIIEYAGADCACVLSSCNDVPEYEAAVILTGRPDGDGTAFITNSTIRNILGHGIVEAWEFDDGDSRNEAIDFTPSNTFENLTGCVQTLPANTVAGGCPDPRPTCP